MFFLKTACKTRHFSFIRTFANWRLNRQSPVCKNQKRLCRKGFDFCKVAIRRFEWSLCKMDVGASPKTTQSLARHATLEMTMNVYGRAREDNRRDVVEALGKMLSAGSDAKDGLEAANHGQRNYQLSTNSFDIGAFLKSAHAVFHAKKTNHAAARRNIAHNAP